MKFSTKGDDGQTNLLGGQRIPKYDNRPDAYGTLDEASSALGIVRAMVNNWRIKEIILGVQKDLLVIGAELATLPENITMLSQRIGPENVTRIEEIIDRLQNEVPLKSEFIYPGKTLASAHVDVGRTIIRRAERKAARLKDEGLVHNADLHRYLNRLADMLFVLARFMEEKV